MVQRLHFAFEYNFPLLSVENVDHSTSKFSHHDSVEHSNAHYRKKVQIELQAADC